jgi:hypothetical protein
MHTMELEVEGGVLMANHMASKAHLLNVRFGMGGGACCM